MRENIGLFRGKWIDNGEWIEGCLQKVIIDDKTYYFIFGEKYLFVYGKVKSTDHAIVDPDTIGECTGLKDKTAS